MDGQYREAFDKAREISDETSENELTLKVVGYGAYSGFKLAQKGKLTIQEKIDYLKLLNRFKTEFPKHDFKTVLSRDHNAFKKSPIKGHNKLYRK